MAPYYALRTSHGRGFSGACSTRSRRSESSRQLIDTGTLARIEAPLTHRNIPRLYLYRSRVPLSTAPASRSPCDSLLRVEGEELLRGNSAAREFWRAPCTLVWYHPPLWFVWMIGCWDGCWQAASRTGQSGSWRLRFPRKSPLTDHASGGDCPVAVRSCVRASPGRRAAMGSI